ncbi:efflux RND transporter periplasmic adaptor subunit [Sandaracinus amylolyticus]|uniref:efflux RND transporter periplasmic adaptor subunit n=1 Tax=Sandaracinus amylolyticus TaxID=927083 RepID=UPI001F00F612|nr:efflux RND transporter periplasmic adaptor subunit [Sandaracinus amylolyticus]UJR78751.1 Membrane fusion protein, cobalt-zinc-cadmium efflux system [Sandaracinus amylolyticus]
MHRATVPILIAASLLSGCGDHADAQESEFRPGTAQRLDDGAVRIRDDSASFIETATIGDEQVSALVRAPGRVAFREGAVSEVGAPVDGRITEVHARVGQRVEVGDPLVTIASPSAAAVRGELARARVMVQAAEAELARQEQMTAAGVGVEVDRVRAHADLAQARAMLSALSASAASIGRGSAATVRVRAPIAGTVLARRASVGLAVEAGGEPLVVLGERNAVWIVAEVFERELPLVHEGATAHVSLAAAAEAVSARVDAIGGAVDPETRRAPVFLALEGAISEHLRAGMYARAEIEVGDAGLGIPTSSVLVKDGGRTVVFVARDERTFLARDVQLGAPVRGRAPVLRGLERGERIVTRGALLLDGQADLLR